MVWFGVGPSGPGFCFRIRGIWRGFNADDWDPLVVTDP